MQYLKAVLDETLRQVYLCEVTSIFKAVNFAWQWYHAITNLNFRLYPPVPMERKTSIADDTLPNGLFIPRGVSDVFYIHGIDYCLLVHIRDGKNEWILWRPTTILSWTMVEWRSKEQSLYSIFDWAKDMLRTNTGTNTFSLLKHIGLYSSKGGVMLVVAFVSFWISTKSCGTLWCCISDPSCQIWSKNASYQTAQVNPRLLNDKYGNKNVLHPNQACWVEKEMNGIKDFHLEWEWNHIQFDDTILKHIRSMFFGGGGPVLRRAHANFFFENNC